MPKKNDKQSKQEIDRVRCIQMKRDGRKINYIASKLKRHRSLVLKWSKRSFDRTKTAHRSGRPLILLKESKKIIIASRKRRRGSSRILVRKLRRKNIQKISRSTILRFQRKNGQKWYKRQRKPALSKKNIKDRKSYGTKFGKHSKLWWDRVLFTDETYFGLSEKVNLHNDGVWCENADEVPPCTEVKYDKKLMVWGGFSSKGVTKLIWFKPGVRLNARMYMRKILIPVMKDIKKRQSKENNLRKTRLFTDLNDFIFQQDGASSHTANNVQKWLSNTENVPNFIDKHDWPGNSPDMNPIENMWAIMFYIVYEKGSFRTIDALKRKVESVWNGFDIQMLENLARSSKKRCACVSINPAKKAPY